MTVTESFKSYFQKEVKGQQIDSEVSVSHLDFNSTEGSVLQLCKLSFAFRDFEVIEGENVPSPAVATLKLMPNHHSCPGDSFLAIVQQATK